jgi:hypothetical protein
MAADTVIGAIVVGVTTIWAAVGTRRSSREATSITGFSELMEAHHADMAVLREERDRDRARIGALERARDDSRRLARLHERWDWTIQRKLEQCTGETVPDPPPLYPAD